MNYTFPIITDTHEGWPKESKCPVCGKKGIFEPNSFVCLSGGALLGETTPHCDGEVSGFLDVVWHGCHTRDGGVGPDPDIIANVPIATGDHTMQFDLYFCSTRCLRAFLNTWVDALEKKIKDEKQAH